MHRTNQPLSNKPENHDATIEETLQDINAQILALEFELSSSQIEIWNSSASMARSGTDDVHIGKAHDKLLEQELANLKEQRNRLAASICRLPEEILSQILIHWQLGVMNEIGPHYVGKSLLICPWLASAPICRYIWAVALQTPELWSIIQIGYASVEHSRKWIDLCTRRGRGFTLYVTLSPAIWNSAEIISELRPRTRSLYLYDDLTGRSDGYWDSLMFFILQQAWSILEVIEMHSIHFPGIRPKAEDSPWLEGSCDALTTLRLVECDTWLLRVIPCLPNLSHLAIDIANPDQSSLTSLAKMISRQPLLVSLTVDYSSSQFLKTFLIQAARPAKCRLPQLRSIRLRGQPNLLHYLLDLLPDPEDSLSIDLHVDGNHAVELLAPAQKSIAHLIDRALIYKRSSPAADPQAISRMYKVVLENTHMLRGHHFERIPWKAMPFMLLPIEPSSVMVQERDRVRQLRLTALCDQNVLQQVLREVRTVELGAYHPLDEALNSMWQVSTVEHLMLLYQPACHIRTRKLEWYLQGRREPLETLRMEVHPSAYVDHKRDGERWYEKGYSKEIIINKRVIGPLVPE